MTGTGPSRSRYDARPPPEHWGGGTRVGVRARMRVVAVAVLVGGGVARSMSGRRGRVCDGGVSRLGAARQPVGCSMVHPVSACRRAATMGVWAPPTRVMQYASGMRGGAPPATMRHVQQAACRARCCCAPGARPCAAASSSMAQPGSCSAPSSCRSPVTGSSSAGAGLDQSNSRPTPERRRACGQAGGSAGKGGGWVGGWVGRGG